MAKDWSTLAKVIFKRTYSRRLFPGTTLERLETYPETVDRAIMGNVRNHNVSEKEIERLRYFMNERKAGPAGRGLWFSGTDAHYKIGGVALNNCFSGSEKLITREHGPVSFAEVVGSEVTVWTKEGWKSAVVNSFGEQRVQRISFAPATADGRTARSNHRVNVTATPDHVEGRRCSSGSGSDRSPGHRRRAGGLHARADLRGRHIGKYPR